MKKLFTLTFIIWLTLGFGLSAQSTRLVLAEEFTQASCPPCATQNPAFNTLLNANPTKVVAIKYQTDWPGDDPMNVQTAGLVQQRVDYYHPDSVGVPYAVMDGIPQAGSTLSYTGAPGNWTQTKLNARAAITSPFDLSVSHTISSSYDSIFITVNINCTQAVSGSLFLRVAVIERVIDFCTPPGSNGETVFPGVMRLMLPDGNGTSIGSSWIVAQTQTLTFKARIPAYIYDKNQLAVVAFIQDDQYCHWPLCSVTPTVHQAAYSAPVPPLTNDVKMGCLSGTTEYSCNAPSPINISYTIQNNGSANLTAANVTYSLDGAVGVVIPWTGNLSPNGTATLTLPTLNPPPGVHNIQISVSDPNNTGDLNPGKDMQEASFTTYGTVGHNLPLSEAFSTSTFPPTEWRIVNPNNGVTWVYAPPSSGAGLYGLGCAGMLFYSSGNGQIDELWTSNYDFSVSGTTSAQLDFDEAYSSYQGANDRLEVLYSTNCGTTWTSIYNESGTVLAGGNPDTVGFWIPWNNSQWHHKTATLSGAIGSSSVFIKFKGTSAYGNNLFVDNINVSTNLTTSVPVLTNKEEINVYPNPSNGMVYIRLNLKSNEDVSVVITNALGAVVRTLSRKNISSENLSFDLSTEAKGTYNVSVRTNDNVVTKRISITQ